MGNNFKQGKSNDRSPSTELHDSKTRGFKKRNRGVTNKDDFERGQKRQLKTEAEFNDYRWYTQDSALTSDVSMLNWNVPLGSDQLDAGLFESGFGGSIRYLNTGAKTNIPGITAIDFAMMPGISADPNSPINVAARNVYITLRKTVTSQLRFGASDAMSVILAEDSLAAYYAWMCRLYGILSTYSSRNRFIGKALVQALGVNYEDAVANMVQLKTFIDIYRVKVNQFAFIPKDFGFINRHTFMCQGVYCDSKSTKSQLFVFRPTFFYQWREFDTSALTGGSHVMGLKFNTSNKTINGIITYGRVLLEGFMADSDVSDIIAMFQRAYGDSGSVQLAEIPANYTVVPVYSENVLGQIHNAHIVRFADEWTSGIFGAELPKFQVTQVPSVPTPGGYNDFYLKTTPLEWKYPEHSNSEGTRMVHNIPLLLRQFMDTYNPDQPTLEEIIDNSRSYVTFTANVTNFDFDLTFSHGGYPVNGTFTLSSCGLDIWHCMTVYFLGPDQQSIGSGHELWSGMVTHTDQGYTETLQLIAKLASASACDWMPRIVVMDVGTNMAKYDTFEGRESDYAADIEREAPELRETPVYLTWVGDFWDYNNPAVITPYNIEVLHLSCMLGAFKVKLNGDAWK